MRNHVLHRPKAIWSILVASRRDRARQNGSARGDLFGVDPPGTGTMAVFLERLTSRHAQSNGYETKTAQRSSGPALDRMSIFAFLVPMCEVYMICETFHSLSSHPPPFPHSDQSASTIHHRVGWLQHTGADPYLTSEGE